jgi:parallel beta-helix repeat protein
VVAATVIQGATFAAGADANSVLEGFTISGPGPGISCEAASPRIDHCCIVDNGKSGIVLSAGSNPLLTNCIIAGNGGDGIDMSATQGSRQVVYGRATILHCDILGNRGNGIRGGIPTVDSTIIRANGGVAGTAQITANTPTVSYSNVQGGWPGEGNIDADPDFVKPGYWADPTDPNEPAVAGDTNAVWVGGDYGLKAGSPCIDAGNPGVITWMDVEIKGMWRAVGSAPDIGAYEFGMLPF